MGSELVLKMPEGPEKFSSATPWTRYRTSHSARRWYTMAIGMTALVATILAIVEAVSEYNGMGSMMTSLSSRK